MSLNNEPSGGLPRDISGESKFLELTAAMNEQLLISALREKELREAAEKRGDDALKFSELRYRRLFEAAKDGIVIVDPANGKITDANPFIAILLGYQREELEGKELWQIGLLKDEAAHRAAFQELREKGFIRYDHLPLRTKSGTAWDAEFVSNVYEEGGVKVIQCNIRDITQRKAAERVLAERARLLDLSNDAIIVRDVANRITYWNHGAEELFGWSREQAVGQDLHGLLKTEFEAPHPQLMAELRHKHRLIGEVVQTAKDGRRLSLLCRWSLDHNANGEPASILTTATDITERKKTEQELGESLGYILTSITDGFHVVDAEGRFTQFNAAARAMFAEQGIDVEGFLGKRIFEEVLVDGRESDAAHALMRSLTTHTANSVTSFYEPWHRWMNVRHFPTPGGGVATFFQDVTDRQRAAEAMRESEERFRLLAENIAQLAWMADAKGDIFWYNRRWFEYTGTTLEEMQGWGWEKVHHPDHITRVTEKWRRHLNAGEAWADDFPLRGADGKYRWFLSRAFPILDEKKKVVRWFGTNTDMDDQRAATEALAHAKEQLEAASRAKDSFLAALSHELRTPLTPVLLTAAALREDKQLPEATREQLSMIERNITLEARLIDDLLDLTTISHGKLKIRLEQCDAHELIKQAAEMVSTDARAKEITIQLQLLASPSALTADPTRFQQVIWNLLRNAVKFTPQGGRIILKSWAGEAAEGKRLWIEVADTGIGISPLHLTQIFLPFDQGGLAGDHRFGGVGLGLAIARAVVEAQGGKITAASEGKNHGATFLVELPVVINTSSPFRTVPAKSRNTAKTAPLRLLLVEDHESTLQTLAQLLRRDGHTVVTSMSVVDALAAAAREKFDLVISDLGLPDGNGVEMMTSLRRDFGLKGIALSGYGMEEDIARSRNAGFFTHLVKPIAIVELRRALATVPSL